MTVCLFTIDPQVDFCEGGALPVTGATKDLERLSKMVDKHGDNIDDIQITLDSHYVNHIAHPCWWQDSTGSQPAPFTLISVGDVESSKWRPRNPLWKDWALKYVKQLEANKRFVLCIWPIHCVIGSIGSTILPVYYDAVTRWETKYYGMAPRITKGSNPFTEHFSCVKADVPDPKDPGTRLNVRLVDTLKEYDDILIAGEALSHCVNFSVSDVAEEFSVDQVKKFVLLEDASSSVTGFEKQGQDFINKMTAKGMRIARTDTFFK